MLPRVERVYAPDLERCARALLVLLAKKEAAPILSIGAAEVDALESPPKERPTMNRVTHVARSMSDAADERSLGAEVHPGLSDARPGGEERARP